MQIFQTLSEMPDPRTGMNIVYPLRDIITLTFCAVLSQADSWDEIADFGRLNKKWLKHHFNISKIPSHDTFRRFFLLLNKNVFEKYFISWIKDIWTHKSKHISFDGKTSRRSFDNTKEIPAVHILNAFDRENSLVLAQRKTGVKTNEISAIKEMLDMLDVGGAIITIDAIGTQKSIAEKIIEKKADYVLSVKDNQKKLHEGIIDCFTKEYLPFMNGYDRFHEPEHKAHGRIEERTVQSYNIDQRIRKKLQLDEWANCKSIIEINRKQLVNGQLSDEKQYYISSVQVSAKDSAAMIRDHWNIENKLHWTLDVVFREDDCRKRAGNTAENFSLIRKIAFNILTRKQVGRKRSLRAKRKAAAWSRSFLLGLLF